MNENPSPRPTTASVVIVIMLGFGAILAGKAIYGRLAYGDASCGFKNCVEVK